MNQIYQFIYSKHLNSLSIPAEKKNEINQMAYKKYN